MPFNSIFTIEKIAEALTDFSLEAIGSKPTEVWLSVIQNLSSRHKSTDQINKLVKKLRSTFKRNENRILGRRMEILSLCAAHPSNSPPSRTSVSAKELVLPSHDYPSSNLVAKTACADIVVERSPVEDDSMEKLFESPVKNIHDNSPIFDGFVHPLDNQRIWKGENQKGWCSFKIPEAQWLSIVDSVIDRSVTLRDWADIVRQNLKKFNPYCSIAFKSHNFNGLKSSPIMKCFGYCSFKSCPTRITVVCPNSEPGTMKAMFSGNIFHVGIKATKLKGKRRGEMRATMKANLPRRTALDCLGNQSKDVWESGNRDFAPNQGVLKKVRQEANHIDVPSKDQWESLRLIRQRQVVRDAGNPLPGTLQRVSEVPEGLMMWSYETLRLFRLLASVDAVFIDATGSILRGMSSTFYIYEIVARHPVPRKAPIALASFVSNRHNIPTVAGFLMQFRGDEQKVFGKKNTVRKFICDGSIVLIKSILLIYMEDTFKTYLSRCYRVVTGVATATDLDRPFLRLCASHVIKNFKTLCKLNQSRYREMMHIFGHLVTSSDWQSILLQIHHLTILLHTRNETLAIKSKHFLYRGVVEDEIGMEDLADDMLLDGEVVIDTHDDPFHEILRITVSSALVIVNDGGREGENQFFCPEMFQSFEKNFLPRIPLITGLMSGNLSRFGDGEGYQKYGHFFEGLQSCPFQNLSDNCRTSGSMEKSNDELKSTRLRGRRFSRLDECAISFDDLNESLIREFYDNMHYAVGKKRKLFFGNVAPEDELFWLKRYRGKSNNYKGLYTQPPTKELRGVKKKPPKGRKNDVIISDVIPPKPMKARFTEGRRPTASLGRITQECGNILSSTNAWLNSDIIDHVMWMLSRQCPAIDGLCCSAAYNIQCGPFYTPSNKFVQILNINSNHWITVSNVFSKTCNEVQVYDSSYTSVAYNDATLCCIGKLCRPDSVNLTFIFPDVQQQSNCSNCGVFAIAYAISLCFGERPDGAKYIERHLRRDCLNIMRLNRVVALHVGINNSSSLSRTQCVPIYCLCRLPYSKLLDRMVECSSCKAWYHFGCSPNPVPEIVAEIADLSWYCYLCQNLKKQ